MNKDPIRMIAKYNGKCSKCQEPIRKGDEMFFFPASPRRERSFCYECGEQSWLDSQQDSRVDYDYQSEQWSNRTYGYSPQERE